MPPRLIDRWVGFRCKRHHGPTDQSKLMDVLAFMPYKARCQAGARRLDAYTPSSPEIALRTAYGWHTGFVECRRDGRSEFGHAGRQDSGWNRFLSYNWNCSRCVCWLHKLSIVRSGDETNCDGDFDIRSRRRDS